MTRRQILTTLLLPLGLLASAGSAFAKLPDHNYWRWFEVEVLLFKHTVEQNINEQFPLAIEPIAVSSANDLLSAHYNRDFTALRTGLGECDSWPEFGQFSDFSWRFDCYYSDENQWITIPGNPFAPPSNLSLTDTTAVVVDGNGGNIETARSAFLLPSATHVLSETRTELARKGLAKPLLHVAWRQPVFTEKQNYKFRLFGGKQFSDEFRYDGYKKEATTGADNNMERSLIERVQTLLSQVDNNQLRFKTDVPENPPRLDNYSYPQNVWELDGLLHIFLIGNYLHIDNEFNLREVAQAELIPEGLSQQAKHALSGESVEQSFLRAFNFDQRRRVISHETHYFDHPKVGMVVQIRRTDLSAPRY